MLRKLRGNNKKGFTLIELMIVIAIIGILAAIAIPNFIAYRNKAYCSRAESDAANVLAGIACFFAEPGNRSVPQIGTLQGDMTCNVEMNEYEGTANDPIIYDLSGAWASATGAVIADNVPMAVQVTDASKLCPRALDANENPTLVYTVFLGTELPGRWMTSGAAALNAL